MIDILAIKLLTMKKVLSCLFIVSLAILGYSFHSPEKLTKTTRSESKDLSTANSDLAFDKMMQVLMHKRCVNCHPAGDVPLQGEDSHLHHFNVQRGEDGHGLASYTCNTCHQKVNNDFSGVPGAPEWALAPLEMAWEGKTRIEIARQMMDPKRNGGRNIKELEKHLTEHKLVLWAWEPGVDAEGNPRELPPVPKDEYISAVKEWIEAGAIIPEQ